MNRIEKDRTETTSRIAPTNTEEEKKKRSHLRISVPNDMRDDDYCTLKISQGKRCRMVQIFLEEDGENLILRVQSATRDRLTAIEDEDKSINITIGERE